MKITEKDKIKRELVTILPEDFPTGLIVRVSTYVEKWIKAFGGCTKCYGKGYGTQTLLAGTRRNKWKLPTVVFCTCDRGKQLKSLMVEKEEVLSILTDEINTAHTTKSGKTSRLTGAYMRITKLSK